MHLLPQLRRLEERYPEELVVLGIHSAKFTTEQEIGNLRQAVLRYDIRHPVANDKEFVVWRQYGIRAWPTLLLVGPNGVLLGKHEGEMPFEELDRVVGMVAEEYDRRSLLKRSRMQWALEREREAIGRPLAFPSKVLADEKTGRLFIADSGHHRIVVTDLEGELVQVVGHDVPGFQDGPHGSASFRNPQGLVLAEGSLYVADTENHAIRRIDLGSWRVETVAGTGEPAAGYSRGGAARKVALRSPWDITMANGMAYIAMAGSHQLWSLDPPRGTIEPFAGSGHEGIQDGPRHLAWLAQPSGLATDGRRLFFADSETSAIRLVDLDQAGLVSTIVGVDLFAFGDVDGVGDQVRLQHPLGLCYHGGTLYVADTYNSKIKSIGPDDGATTTFVGDGMPGLQDGVGIQTRLFEPGGLSAAAGRLYIADTNNHAIRVAELASGRLNTLTLRGL